MTAEELGRFTKAFKDDNFRKMLRDYAEEISDPENRKKYEEEIAILEQDRGNSVQFIHPTPFKCVKTRVDGKLKGYVNVCASDKIGKPSCTKGVSEDGTSGHHWSLPHSLHAERKEMDSKGNKILIYDVVFHPDTLHMASTNKRFMDMVMTVALEGIQNAFNVCLEKNKIRTLSTKYKGNPRACVIRKPIPGFQAKDGSDDPHPLAFPYPHNNPTVSKKEGPQNSQSRSENVEKTQGPTKPRHTLKYRSFIDLQDFRCSRDSGQSPRSREIVITIDLPLLKSVAAVSLEVEEKSLMLESKDPAYKLELSFAYAVDEDRGEAKFNSQTRQLVVTLPVKPFEGFQINSCPVEESAGDIQEEVVFERESEAEWHDTDLSNSKEGNAEEKTGETRETEEREEGAAEEVRNQHQEDNDQRMCEGQQDGTKMERERVTYDQMGQIGEVKMQKIQADEVKGVEIEQETIQELKTVQKPKDQIREDSVKAEKDKPEATANTEDSVRPTELVTTGEEMNKDHLNSENGTEKASAPPVLLREVHEDGSQTLISDHSTTAGFSFHNTLLFELD